MTMILLPIPELVVLLYLRKFIVLAAALSAGTDFHSFFFSQSVMIYSSGCGSTDSAIFLLPLKLGQAKTLQ